MAWEESLQVAPWVLVVQIELEPVVPVVEGSESVVVRVVEVGGYEVPLDSPAAGLVVRAAVVVLRSEPGSELGAALVGGVEYHLHKIVQPCLDEEELRWPLSSTLSAASDQGYSV